MRTTFKLLRLGALAAALVLPLAGPALALDKVIHAGKLFDGASGRIQSNMSILVHDDRITKVVEGFVTPAGAEVIDLSGQTVLPGFIDVHVHIAVSSLDAKLRNSPEDQTLIAADNARKTLMAGFTSVRDCGGDIEVTAALKRAVNKGLVPGPRLWVAGQPLGPTGGHGDPSNDIDASWDRHDEWMLGVVDSPEAAVHAVRKLRQQGADLIKIMPSGGVASVGDDPNLQLMTDAEISAVVQTAHSLGMKVAAHAHGRAAIDAAVRLGVDSIEHGTYAGPESYAAMKQKGVYLVGTLTVAQDIYRIATTTPDKLPPGVAQKAIAVTPTMMGNVASAYKAGVKLALGTDTFGLRPHGQNGAEFEYLVKAGVSPVDAILAGTRNGADLIGSGDIGVIAPGRYADLVAITGDPLSDIKLLENVQFVMKGGAVYKSNGRAVDGRP
jgi:imidazolonepropionase-like amidohydrolase